MNIETTKIHYSSVIWFKAAEISVQKGIIITSWLLKKSPFGTRTTRLLRWSCLLGLSPSDVLSRKYIWWARVFLCGVVYGKDWCTFWCKAYCSYPGLEYAAGPDVTLKIEGNNWLFTPISWRVSKIWKKWL